MSEERTLVIECPKCHARLEYDIIDCIDSETNAFHKLSLMNQKLFEVKCPHCQVLSDFYYDFVYRDRARKTLIYFVQEERAEGVAIATMLNRKMAEADGTRDYDEQIRVVSNLDTLIEKINILDNGLDDRVVEIMKLMCMSNAIEELKDLDPQEIYYVNHNGEHSFELQGTNGTAIAAFPNGMYQDVSEDFADVIENCECVFVDYNWAANVIEAEWGDEEEDIDEDEDEK